MLIKKKKYFLSFLLQEYFAEKFDKESPVEDTRMDWLKPGLLLCVGVSLAALFSMKMQ